MPLMSKPLENKLKHRARKCQIKSKSVSKKLKQKKVFIKVLAKQNYWKKGKVEFLIKKL